MGVSNLHFFQITELMCVLESKIRESQRQGRVIESHNTLSLSDVRVIFKYLDGLAHTPDGYRDRLVFDVG